MLRPPRMDFYKCGRINKSILRIFLVLNNMAPTADDLDNVVAYLKADEKGEVRTLLPRTLALSLSPSLSLANGCKLHKPYALR